MEISHNDASKKVLINFRIPIHMKQSFDAVCRHQGVTKTSVLATLLKDWIRDNAAKSRREIQDYRNATIEIGNSIESREKFFCYDQN
jgi:antitoxin component of RelBE/YafQ-DinJ toxin-antitoxin module